MSWEVDSETYYNCACSNKGVVETRESDDWFRTRKNISIVCEQCSKKYKIINLRSGYALFPREVKLPQTYKKQLYWSISPHDEYLANVYPKKELIELVDIAHKATNSLKENDYRFHRFVLDYIKWYNTGNIKKIREDLENSIKIYDNFVDNYDNTIRAAKENIKKTNELINKYAISIKPAY